MPSARLAGCLMEQDWAGCLMRGPTWGRNEVTFQEAETRQSTYHFKRRPLLEKNWQDWLPVSNKKTDYTKGISRLSKGLHFQSHGPRRDQVAQIPVSLGPRAEPPFHSCSQTPDNHGHVLQPFTLLCTYSKHLSHY